ncbi:MAG: hypothetical protein O3C29_12700 [Proteobacteria bacterium]|nr:hypothetical protein [Pseudomonadota bacterium]MDA1290150.1 hypothetical protein [Pseudomonadota bacterium]
MNEAILAVNPNAWAEHGNPINISLPMTVHLGVIFPNQGIAH